MNGLTAHTPAPLNPLQTGNGTNEGGWSYQDGYKSPPPRLLGHYSPPPVDANMANYNEEVCEYILEQLRLENAILRMANIRLDHSIAILRSLPPAPQNMRWLCIIDWCLNDIANAQAQVELWWRRLELIRDANALVTSVMTD